MALRESERKYRQLHESLIDGFVRFDKYGKIKEVNEAFYKMVGYEPEELRKLTAKDLTPEKWHAVIDEIFENQVVPRGYSEIYEKEYRRKDGVIIPVELRTYLLLGETREPCGTWAIVRTSPAEASGGRTPSCQGSRRSRQPCEERVPGQHEPRNPHADERHHRHDRTRARYDP